MNTSIIITHTKTRSISTSCVTAVALFGAVVTALASYCYKIAQYDCASVGNTCSIEDDNHHTVSGSVVETERVDYYTCGPGKTSISPNNRCWYRCTGYCTTCGWVAKWNPGTRNITPAGLDGSGEGCGSYE
jgi:hypothetical protein